MASLLFLSQFQLVDICLTPPPPFYQVFLGATWSLVVVQAEP